MTLGEAASTLLHKSGYLSPERQREIDALRARQARQAAQQSAESYRRTCNVWPRYAHAALAEVEYARARLTVEEFGRYIGVRDELATLTGAPGILVLYGDNGPGKTHLASALVHAFCDRNMEALFMTANDFFIALRSTIGEKGRTLVDVIQKFRRPELLVIDEIEVRSDSNWENQQLRDLVNARYSMVKSTVILTNKTADEINGVGGTPYFSNAIRDRIRHEGDMLACDWPSLRGDQFNERAS